MISFSSKGSKGENLGAEQKVMRRRGHPHMCVYSKAPLLEYREANHPRGTRQSAFGFRSCWYHARNIPSLPGKRVKFPPFCPAAVSRYPPPEDLCSICLVQLQKSRNSSNAIFDRSQKHPNTRILHFIRPGEEKTRGK